MNYLETTKFPTTDVYINSYVKRKREMRGLWEINLIPVLKAITRSQRNKIYGKINFLRFYPEGYKNISPNKWLLKCMQYIFNSFSIYPERVVLGNPYIKWLSHSESFMQRLVWQDDGTKFYDISFSEFLNSSRFRDYKGIIFRRYTNFRFKIMYRT